MKRKRLRKRATFPTAPPTETWYDLEYDHTLIVQSVAKQYGLLPSAQDEMSYSEWLLLVSGLMEDTPLGQVVLIRKENNKDRLKHFTQHEHHIRNEWRNFRAKQKLSSGIIQKPEDIAANFEKMFAKMFG